MACGKPFVGFRTSGLAEVVEDGVTGFFEPIDDVLALAQRCRGLAGNQSMLQAMSASSRERAVSKFSESTAMNAYVATYSEATRQRGE
jgi:glycosyltransferase involved in cell wall biosynthesis